MKISDFRKHRIVKSSPELKTNYREYKAVLRQDFSERCAYCNLKDASVTTYFEVDHFIPRKIFKTDKPSLETDYRNLVYSCKKCNVAKGAKFQGDIMRDNPTNELFYDPAVVDYNDIFYRNELGAIASEDVKGKEMIKLIKLYRPIHILGWVCEEIDATANRLEAALSAEKDAKRKIILEEAYNKMNAQYRKLNKLFIASYNDDEFTLSI